MRDKIYSTLLLLGIFVGVAVAGPLNNVNTTVGANSVFRGALVYEVGGAQTLADATIASITFDTEDYDTSAFHSTSINTERFTIPAGVSRVRVSGNMTISSAVNLVLYIFTVNHFNSADLLQSRIGLPSTMHTTVSSIKQELNIVSGIISVVEGDYFVLKVYQDSDGNEATVHGTADPTWFAIEVIK